MRRLKNIFIILSAVFCWTGSLNTLFSQESKTEYVVTGHIRGSEGEHLPGASLTALQNSRLGVSTDELGYYRLTLPSSGPWTLRCSMTGYTLQEIKLDFGNKTTLNLQITLESTVHVGVAEVSEQGRGNVSIKRIDPRIANRIPSPRGTVEDALLQAPVNFTSELSSSYNVRGGSFDENLV